jgi:hypothetical protein
LPVGEKNVTSSIRLISKRFSREERSELFPINEISPSALLIKPSARRSPPRSESKSGLTA